LRLRGEDWDRQAGFLSQTHSLDCPFKWTLLLDKSIILDMSRAIPPNLPSTARQLSMLGERLRLARKRRRITSVLMAERVGITRTTLGRVERGDATVSLGLYLRVLRVLGLEADIDLVAANDELGRKLQDLAMEPAGRGKR
jgi:DNA-binding XRE family transcriptional regulator